MAIGLTTRRRKREGVGCSECPTPDSFSEGWLAKAGLTYAVDLWSPDSLHTLGQPSLKESIMETKLVWVQGVDQIGYLARVSNPKAVSTDSSAKLIAFLIRNRHWSPFEMASMCVEINTTRDIGRQILRHRSFSFQEFSQRYAAVTELDNPREMRFAGATNRQGSLDTREPNFELAAADLMERVFDLYDTMIRNGIAPECARAVLPEGYTPTRMYMTGTIRSWIHYLQERTQPNVQKEHRLIAESIKWIFAEHCTEVYEAVFPV